MQIDNSKPRDFFCRVIDTCLTNRRESKTKVLHALIAITLPLAVTPQAFADPSTGNSDIRLPPYQASYLEVLGRYVNEAVTHNNNLKKEQFTLESEKAFYDSLKAQFYPSLSLVARASASEGGRTIDFPAGDLLNPVYNALNDQSEQQGRGRPFPTIENQSIPLLRPFEQNTKLVVQGPIYAPELYAKVDAQGLKTEGQSLAKAQFARQLITDVQTAFWQLTQARAQLIALEASLTTLRENERINQALYDAGQVTLDAPKRAQAERLNLEVAFNQAKLQERLALQYINLLRNRPSTTPVATPHTDTLLEHLNAAKPALNPGEVRETPALALQVLDRNLFALGKLKEAAQASYKPEIGYQVEGGYQGESYSGGPNSGFATASVVLSWSLLDAGTRRSEVAKATKDTMALQEQRETVVQQLRLQQVQTLEGLRIALTSIEAREQAARAAQESFRIAAAKRDQGTISQVEFLSAEQLRTRSQIELTNAICQAHIAFANWQNNNHRLPQEIDRSTP